MISVNFNIFQDLIETLKSEVSGDFSEILLALFEPPALYDALCCKQAIQVSPSIIQVSCICLI